jgi:hypothetical protein
MQNQSNRQGIRQGMGRSRLGRSAVDAYSGRSVGRGLGGACLLLAAGCAVASTTDAIGVSVSPDDSLTLQNDTEVDCLAGQDLDADDVDVTTCPPLPQYPEAARVGTASVSLGAWELGTTSTGETYKYGGLSTTEEGTTVLTFEGGSAPVDETNLTCWAKGYYRLRSILHNPPAEWLALRGAGFQHRFFQFQTDLRNGSTGYRRIASYMDHLVKWVTVVGVDGSCEQPTLRKFRAYAAAELARRGIPFTENGDGGADAAADGSEDGSTAAD